MTLARILAVITTIAIAGSVASGEDRSNVKKAALRDEPLILCGTGLAGADCEMARGIMRLALSRLSTPVSDWRVVVIPHSLWNETADYFHIERSTPAFSNVNIHTTYVESDLLFQDGRVNENLQRYTNLSGTDKLMWVMAHEYGHILCQTTDERKATAAAGRLIYGRREVCR